uniref:Leucine-rich repeat transmembrane protein kinase n=1 Tax=Populus alba TaxID=43335 RepID=A0A4V6A7W9_POPAL|nr:leucine-rich repeat transmembrane protein kinase [Populus alba]
MKKKTLISLSLLLSLFALSFSIEDDITCLEGVKKSFTDPLSRLTSWTFNNNSVAFVCKLNGVSCWNEKENRIISLQLSSFQLSGKLPESLKYCHSLTTLDLSNNDLSGPIPPEICNWLPYIVSLDLSGNKFSGPIPPEIVNCKFLNNLILSGNQLTGSIPFGLGRLDRLKTFSVASNKLSGSIPDELGAFPKDDFDGNDGLCGKPLAKCGGLSSKSLGIIIVAGVVGAGGSLILGFVIWWWLFVRGGKRKRGSGVGGVKGADPSWIELLRSHKLVQVTLFQKPIVKIKLADILAATNSFDFENIVISTRTGDSYKADLPDGSSLAIKRLNACKLGEKQFRGEMNRLGELRHPNLVPLLGYCAVEVEKLLVYKHMPNGTLYSQLHGSGKDAIDKALTGKGHDDEIMQFLRVAWSCVVSRPKDRPSMYQVYESLKGLAEKHGFSDQYDEFPLIFGKQDPDYKE